MDRPGYQSDFHGTIGSLDRYGECPGRSFGSCPCRKRDSVVAGAKVYRAEWDDGLRDEADGSTDANSELRVECADVREGVD